jgi:hypothetical protein
MFSNRETTFTKENNMTFKSAMSGIGNGILVAGTAINNAPINQRIAEIEEEMTRLQDEKARLEDRLI